MKFKVMTHGGRLEYEADAQAAAINGSVYTSDVVVTLAFASTDDEHREVRAGDSATSADGAS